MFITTPFENIRGVVNRSNFFINCYIFVLVGFFRRLKHPDSYVVMDSKDNLMLDKEYFTKPHPKEYVSVVSPWTEPLERSS